MTTTTTLLRPSLQRRHAEWLAEVKAVLGAAQQPDAGIWERWTALHYLQTAFPSRLDEERRLVNSVMPRLSEAQRTTLWALGELLETLRSQLDHLVGLCHRAGEFHVVAAKIQTALDYWCHEVDEDVGPFASTVVPTELGGTPAARVAV